MNTFSPTAAISFGWNIFKANVGFSLIILAIIVVPQIIVSSLTGSGPKNPEDINAFFGVSLFANLILSLVSAVVALGVTKALLNLVDTGKGNVSDVLIPFKQPKMVLNFFLAYLLIFGVVILLVPVMVVLGVLTLGLGFLVLIPLAIFFGVRLQFFYYLIVDRMMGPIEAYKGSWAITKGNFWNLVGFGFLSFLVILLGAIALLVGLLAAVPVVMIAAAFVYRQLSGKPTTQAAPVTPPAPVAPPAPEPAAPAMPQQT